MARYRRLHDLWRPSDHRGGPDDRHHRHRWRQQGRRNGIRSARSRCGSATAARTDCSGEVIAEGPALSVGFASAGVDLNTWRASAIFFAGPTSLCKTVRSDGSPACLLGPDSLSAGPASFSRNWPQYRALPAFFAEMFDTDSILIANDSQTVISSVANRRAYEMVRSDETGARQRNEGKRAANDSCNVPAGVPCIGFWICARW